MSLTAWLEGVIQYLKSLESDHRRELAIQRLEREHPAWGAKLRAAWERQK
jgi:hypothetical protein